MAINSDLIKKLREKTNAGFMACKKALDESNYDLQQAEEFLRKNGLMEAVKKSSRTTADGLISSIITNDLKHAAIVEVNSETDFVAKNDKFQQFVRNVTILALDACQEKILSEKFPNSNKTTEQELQFLISVIGENIQFKRSQNVSVQNGVIGTYTHNAIAPGEKMGKIGVLVCLETDNTSYDLEEAKLLGKKLSMHIAASSPRFLSINSVPNDVLQKEKEIAKEQAIASGKPENIAEKIAEGRVKKFYEESVLLEQEYFEDGQKKVKEVLTQYNNEHGTSFVVSQFVRYQLGE